MVIPGSYSQRDPKWGSVPLGFNSPGSGYDIYHYGCLITALANLFWYTGHNMSPLEVNNWLKGNGGFIQGGLLVWSKVTAMDSDLREHGMTASLPQANNFVEAEGNFAVLQVTKPGFPMHYVLLIRPGVIVDSWDGAEKPASSYNFIVAHLYGDISPDFVTVPQPHTALPIEAPKGEPMIGDSDNEYWRWNKLFVQIRGREASRDEFRASAVGRNWLQAMEILSDSTEADAATNAAAVEEAENEHLKAQLAQIQQPTVAQPVEVKIPTETVAPKVNSEPEFTNEEIPQIAITKLTEPRKVTAPSGAIVYDLVSEQPVGQIDTTKPFDVMAWTQIGKQYYFLVQKMYDQFPHKYYGIPNQQLREVSAAKPVMNDTVRPQDDEGSTPMPGADITHVAIDSLTSIQQFVVKSLHGIHGEWDKVFTSKKGK